MISNIAALPVRTSPRSKPLGSKKFASWRPRHYYQKGIERYGVSVYNDLDAAVVDCDVIIGLRIQNERIGSPLPSTSEYFKAYGITTERLALAKPDALVMHPGPMNRGVEISSSVADGEQSVILNKSITALRYVWRCWHWPSKATFAQRILKFSEKMTK